MLFDSMIFGMPRNLGGSAKGGPESERMCFLQCREMDSAEVDEVVSLNVCKANQDLKAECEGADEGLLPGLPDDLALQCLVRVPRRCHIALAKVSKKWKEVLSGEEYYSMRKQLALTERWIYVLSKDRSEGLHWYALDPLERKWKELPAMPDYFRMRCGMACEVLERELFVLGGGKKFQHPTSEVIKYDPLKDEWIEAAEMETARCYFVCAAFEGRLYAVGGMGTTSGNLTSWEVYDSAAESWSSFEDANVVIDVGESLVHAGDFYIRHVCANNPVPPAALYNPAQNSWVTVDNDMTKNWCGPTAVAGNDVYMLDETFGLRLMVLDKENLSWKMVGRLSTLSMESPCRLAVVGRNLYVIGKGLRTLVLNVDDAGNTDGIMVSSSIPRPPGMDLDDLSMRCCVLET